MIERYALELHLAKSKYDRKFLEKLENIDDLLLLLMMNKSIVAVKEDFSNAVVIISGG